jgi:hypothetical protein
MGLEFAVEQVPDATTLLHFRHLLEKHKLPKPADSMRDGGTGMTVRTSGHPVCPIPQ